MAAVVQCFIGGPNTGTNPGTARELWADVQKTVQAGADVPT
jgi:hypothetical protein